MTIRTLSASLAALLLGAAAFTFTACDDDNDAQPGKLNFEFENVVGSQPLVFGTTYTNAAGEPFTVSKFNYFVSNIKLTDSKGVVWSEPESYHLVKQSETDSRTFELKNIPPGDYNKLTFTIGVDSARNMSGAQTGALDQLNDMFWNWSSGYVFLKMEGTSPRASNGQLTYHVGGFRSPNNALRTVSPALPAGTVLHVAGDKTPQIHLQADVLKMFTGPTQVSFATMSNTGHSSDPNSVKLANNYAAGMFSVAHVHSGE
jgi:hypothetical protein